ncbi:hypothetical protein LX36DRAFT_654635 [Colletotrichum falcatum]|nr:hypothetical protein LX36DRAFT_654635 [Colletotrichum falcatum]
MSTRAHSRNSLRFISLMCALPPFARSNMCNIHWSIHLVAGIVHRIRYSLQEMCTPRCFRSASPHGYCNSVRRVQATALPAGWWLPPDGKWLKL